MNKYSQDIEILVDLIKKENDEYKKKAKELIDKLNTEKKTMEIQYSIIILNFILNNITLRNIQYDQLSKEDLEIFKKIIQMTSSTPYPKITKHILSLKKKKKNIDLLVDGLLIVYKQFQIEFINKFYSKITLSHLESLLDKEFVNEQLKKNKNWILEKNNVIIQNKPNNNIDAGTVMRSIQFLGQMNTELSKIIKANLLLETKL